MAPDDARNVPYRRRRSPLAGASFLVIGLMLGACDGAFDAEQARQAKIAAQTRQSYEGTLSRLRPAYVLVTYPGTIGSMREVKRRELEIVRSVLDDLAIPYEAIDRTVVSETMTINKREPEAVTAYRVPERVAAKCGTGTIIFLNLDVRSKLKSVRHPDIAGTDLKIMVWDDPIQIGATKRPSM